MFSLFAVHQRSPCLGISMSLRALLVGSGTGQGLWALCAAHTTTRTRLLSTMPQILCTLIAG